MSYNSGLLLQVDYCLSTKQLSSTVIDENHIQALGESNVVDALHLFQENAGATVQQLALVGGNLVTVETSIVYVGC